MRHVVEQLAKLEGRLRAGGGPGKVEKQHRAGKMTARERIAALLEGKTIRKVVVVPGKLVNFVVE